MASSIQLPTFDSHTLGSTFWQPSLLPALVNMHIFIAFLCLALTLAPLPSIAELPDELDFTDDCQVRRQESLGRREERHVDFLDPSRRDIGMARTAVRRSKSLLSIFHMMYGIAGAVAHTAMWLSWLPLWRRTGVIASASRPLGACQLQHRCMYVCMYVCMYRTCFVRMI